MMIPTSLILALIWVESRGNVNAVGAAGELGPLQIKRILVNDVNRLQKGIVFKHSDAKGVIASIFMLRVYLGHYAATGRLGRPATLQDLAMIWHYGPDGFKTPDRDHYWPKVQSALKDQISLTAAGRAARLPDNPVLGSTLAYQLAGLEELRAHAPSPSSKPPSPFGSR